MTTRSGDVQVRPKQAERWERVVAATYRTVGREESVTAAYVVLPRRPTYTEMLRFRAHERSGEIRISMSLRDCVCIRTQPGATTFSMAPEAHGITPGARRMESNRRDELHQPAWMHRLLTMAEGVR